MPTKTWACHPACAPHGVEEPEVRHRGLDAPYTLANRSATSAQFTTFHQAATYSGRRFWYFR